MKPRIIAKWVLLGGFLGYFVVHPVVMVTAQLMSESKLGHSTSDIIVSQALMSLSLIMAPWGLAFAILGALTGFFYGKNRMVENALRESEERFRNLAGSASDAIIVMDGGGHVSFWNEAAQKIFGYTKNEAVGKDLHRLLVPEKYQEAFQKGFGRFKVSGQGEAIGKTLELSALRKDAIEFPIELSLSSFQLKDEWHAVGIVRDISDRRLAESERLQKERMQGVLEMAGAACHELNQPVQSILGYSELLLERISEDNAAYGNAKTISEQVNRMRSIMEKIMEITKYETREYIEGVKIIDIDKASTKL
jgi:PAS domain S-box-containing protein